MNRFLNSWTKALESENLEIVRIRSDNLSHTRYPECRSQLRVQNSLSSELMLFEPVQSQAGGSGIREYLLNLLCIPPSACLGNGVRHGQGTLKAAWISHDVDEFGKNLRSQGKRDVG